MEYGKIISVTGLPGLYELVSSKNDGAIVRSLDDKSTRFVSSRIHNFSHLESIEVYTVRDNVNLVDIFNAMEQSGEKLPDGKDNDALRKYFEKVYPDLDFERVYASDMKKMTKWFGILKANDIEIKLREVEEEEAPVEEAAPVAEPVTEKEKPKAAAKETKEAKATEATEAAEEPVKKAAKPAAKAAVKKEKPADTDEETAEKPKKKAAPKAKAADEDEAKEPAKKKAAPKKEKK